MFNQRFLLPDRARDKNMNQSLVPEAELLALSD